MGFIPHFQDHGHHRYSTVPAKPFQSSLFIRRPELPETPKELPAEPLNKGNRSFEATSFGNSSNPGKEWIESVGGITSSGINSEELRPNPREDRLHSGSPKPKGLAQSRGTSATTFRPCGTRDSALRLTLACPEESTDYSV